jgi:hypothetical protein
MLSVEKVTTEERFIKIRISYLIRNIFLIMFACICATFIFTQDIMHKQMVAENLRLVHNITTLETQLAELKIAKPLDPVTACPAWWANTGTDLKSARKRLCEGK